MWVCCDQSFARTVCCCCCAPHEGQPDNTKTAPTLSQTPHYTKQFLYTLVQTHMKYTQKRTKHACTTCTHTISQCVCAVISLLPAMYAVAVGHHVEVNWSSPTTQKQHKHCHKHRTTHNSLHTIIQTHRKYTHKCSRTAHTHISIYGNKCLAKILSTCQLSIYKSMTS